MKIPVFFITSVQDQVVPSSQTEKIYKAYKGEKKIIFIKGDHNASRDLSIIEEMLKWVGKFLPKTSSGNQVKQRIFGSSRSPLGTSFI